MPSLCCTYRAYLDYFSHMLHDQCPHMIPLQQSHSALTTTAPHPLHALLLLFMPFSHQLHLSAPTEP